MLPKTKHKPGLQSIGHLHETTNTVQKIYPPHAYEGIHAPPSFFWFRLLTYVCGIHISIRPGPSRHEPATERYSSHRKRIRTLSRLCFPPFRGAIPFSCSVSILPPSCPNPEQRVISDGHTGNGHLLRGVHGQACSQSAAVALTSMRYFDEVKGAKKVRDEGSRQSVPGRRGEVGHKGVRTSFPSPRMGRLSPRTSNHHRFDDVSLRGIS